MADLISSVYDIPEWVRKRLPDVGNSAPARFLSGSAKVIPAAIADKASGLYHGALGLEDPNPGSAFDAAMQERGGALDDMTAPIKAGAEAARGGVTNALEYLREQAIKAGAKPVKTDQMPPMNTAPGMIDAELRAGAPQRPMAAPRPARAPVTVTQDGRPSGALPVAPAQAQVQAPAAPQVQASNAPQGALAEPQAQAPRQSLMQLYRQRMAELQPAEGKLTEEEKKQRQLEFFMNMLARNKGGSLFLQNAAAAGLDTSAGIRSDRERARTRATESYNRKRDDIFREIGFGDRDEDNRRGDAAEDRRVKLLEKQINQGKVSVQKDAGSGTYVILDAVTGQRKDTGIKFPREKAGGNANIELIEYIRKLPEDQREIALKALGRAPKEGDDDSMAIFNAAVKRATADLTGNVDIPTAVKEAREGLQAARGGQPMLPKGVPPGSKQVGTSGGKPVFEAPNGKRYKVE